MRTFTTTLLLLLSALVASGPPAAWAIPSDELRKSLRPTGDVNDFAGLLAPAEKESLEARCKQLRERTGAQLAVVTLKSLAGGEIDDFANKLFAHWGIGQKDKKNGVLLLVAMDERRSRIEVGYGLEPIIPDILAGRIVDQQLRPRFREQQYAAGLMAAVNAICELIEKGEPADRAALAEQDKLGVLPMLLFLALFAAAGGFSIGSGLGVKNGGAVLFGLLFAGMAILMGLAAAGILGPLIHVPVACVASVIGWSLVKQDWSQATRSRSGSSPWIWSGPNFPSGGGGGWTSGGSGGFSGGWGGFGGGSSGGGGASGGW